MISILNAEKMRTSPKIESPCEYLMQELKVIWDEVGQDEMEREKVMLELEEECQEIYRKHVDSANISRARLHQQLADAQVEYTGLLASLGEGSYASPPEKLAGSLKQQLNAIVPVLREMQKRKDDRITQFQEIHKQIQSISAEISGNEEPGHLRGNAIDMNDLSLKRLEDYKNELARLHKEKSDRLKKVADYVRSINSLCATLGMDSSKIIADVHPSLIGSSGSQAKNISDGTLATLNDTVDLLKEETQKRHEKLKGLAETLRDLWKIMEIPFEHQNLLVQVTEILPLSSSEVSLPGSLASEAIHKVETEVEKLNGLKASKMKDLLEQKRMELEEICKMSCMVINSSSETDDLLDLIDSGDIDCADLIRSMDEQISQAREEAHSRNDIMEKVERWTAACEEERWLEEYNKDQNRYTVSRGAHKNLKRAERARIIVNKIPALVELLIAKISKWERERNKVFFYEDVPLLALLDEYNLLRQEKEEEKQKQKERKKVQSQVFPNPENPFGPRPSLSASNRGLRTRYYNTSFGNTMHVHRIISTGMNSSTQDFNFMKEGRKMPGQKTNMQLSYIPHLRDDSASQVSATFSGPSSP